MLRMSAYYLNMVQKWIGCDEPVVWLDPDLNSLNIFL